MRGLSPPSHRAIDVGQVVVVAQQVQPFSITLKETRNVVGKQFHEYAGYHAEPAISEAP